MHSVIKQKSSTMELAHLITTPFQLRLKWSHHITTQWRVSNNTVCIKNYINGAIDQCAHAKRSTAPKGPACQRQRSIFANTRDGYRLHQKCSNSYWKNKCPSRFQRKQIEKLKSPFTLDVYHSVPFHLLYRCMTYMWPYMCSYKSSWNCSHIFTYFGIFLMVFLCVL